MSLATPLTYRLDGTRTTTWRQFQKALLAALSAVLVGFVIYAVEKYVLGIQRRFIENPADVMMRALGMAHFLVGWLFLFTSPRLRSWRAAGRLTGWSCLGGLLCWLFAAVGGSKNPFALMAFASFFLVHEIRDQTRLFQIYGDAPPPSPPLSKFLHQLSLTVIFLLMAMLTGMHLIHGHVLGKCALLRDIPGSWLLAGWSLIPLAAAFAGRRAWLLGSAVFDSLGHFRAPLAPLLLVYLGIFGILAVGSVLGSVGLNLIILIHVTNWLVFVHYQLGQQPRATATLWDWLRRSPRGFVALHLVLAGVALTLIALRVHLWGRTGWISDLVAGSAFPYWSLMHICMAFWKAK